MPDCARTVTLVLSAALLILSSGADETAALGEIRIQSANEFVSPAPSSLQEARRVLLRYACYRGKRELAVALLADGANPSGEEVDHDSPPLLLALIGGNEQIALDLLRMGASAEYHLSVEETPLEVAAIKGYSRVERALLRHGAKESLRYWVAKGNRDAVLKTLQADPSKIELTTSSGVTLLHVAASTGRAPIVEILLKLGARPNSRTEFGSTPLHLAATPLRKKSLRQYALCVDLLLAYGGDINAEDWVGETPLSAASARGAREMVRLLEARGALRPREDSLAGMAGRLLDE